MSVNLNETDIETIILLLEKEVPSATIKDEFKLTTQELASLKFKLKKQGRLKVDNEKSIEKTKIEETKEVKTEEKQEAQTEDIPENVKRFHDIATKMVTIYAEKNKKYGNSFGKTFGEYGNPVLCIRLEDKLSRAKQILLNGQTGSDDESVIDTLTDLANYAVMSIMELEAKR